jgi:hypothetical protein
MSLCDNMCKLMGKCLISTERVTFCESDQLVLVLVCPDGKNGKRYVGLDRVPVPERDVPRLD